MPITVKQVTQTEHGATYQTWMVSGRINGKRIRIRCKSEQEALIRKSEQETAAINAERSTRFIQTRLSADQLNEAEACFARLQPKYTLTQATDYFLRHFHAPDFEITVSDASTQFQAALEGTVRPRSLSTMAATLLRFSEFADNANVHEITAATVEAYLHSLRGRNGTDKASKKTWNLTLQLVSQFLGWCRDKKYITENPADGIKRFKLEVGHIDVLDVQKCEELMRHVETYKDGKLVWFFSLALFTGIRTGSRGELEKLAQHPELIDLENKIVRITPAISKTRRARQIGIRPNLMKWLRRYPSEILPKNSKREIAEIRTKFALSRDVLRHSFISYHVMAFGSFAETAIESGNSETVIRNHYFNAVTRSQARAFWKIEP
jgi:site-specific recombinase XerD